MDLVPATRLRRESGYGGHLRQRHRCPHRGYDVLLDQAWSSNAIDRATYVLSWTSRRYYTPNLPSVAVDAWQLLSSTVYSNTDPSSQATLKSILEPEPALTGLVNRTGHHPTLISYNNYTTVMPTLKLLIEAGYELKN